MMNSKRFLCVVVAAAILARSLAASYIIVLAAEESVSFDAEADTAESAKGESSGAESSESVFSEAESSELKPSETGSSEIIERESLESESSELEFSEAGSSEIELSESSEAGSSLDEFPKAESSVEESSVFESASSAFSASGDEVYETVVDIEPYGYESDSFDEGIAPQAEFGGIFLIKILEDLIVAAGVNALGYIGSKQLSKDSAAFNNLKRSILSSPVVASAIDSVRAACDGDLYTLVSSAPVFLEGLKIEGIPGGKTIKLGLSAALMLAAKAAAKEWADSNSNSYEGVATSDKFVEGTVSVNSQYVSSIATSFWSYPSLDSVSDIDSFFFADGAAEYLASQGYTDSSHYFFIRKDTSGLSFKILPIPIGSSFVQFRFSSSGYYQSIMPDSVYNDFVSRLGIVTPSEFSSFVLNAPSVVRTLKFYEYIPSSSSWNVSSDSYFLGFQDFNYFSVYTCNYSKAFESGSTINRTDFIQPAIKRVVLGYNVAGKHITYDDTKAPAVPSEGYVDYNIGEADYSGFDYSDFASLHKYLADIAEKAGEADKKQDEAIEQNKGILEALNNIHSFIKTISVTVGSSGSILASILAAVGALAASTAAAIIDSLNVALSADGELSKLLSIPIEDAWKLTIYPDLAKLLSDLITGDLAGVLADVFPYIPLEDAWRNFIYPDFVKALADAAAKAPAIDIPAVEIPPIVIPDNLFASLAPPSITLNPTYDITVANDFTGLEGIISRAVEGALTKVFVPDQAAAIQKVDAMGEYFKFRDDLIYIAKEFETRVFHITPNPILKIPLGKVLIPKYRGAFGNYFIVDLTWYAYYKEFGDKVILAFVWAVFIWRLFVLLPGIINGAVGGFFRIGDLQLRYNDRAIHEALTEFHILPRMPYEERSYTEKE